MFKFLRNLILSVFLHLLTLTLLVKAAKQNEIICKTATIRSINDFNQLQNCTIMVGNVRIVNMYFTEPLLEQVVPSNIEEITGYLLAYRVEGLDSLDRLFPKLIVIRGVELLYDQYSLTLIENRELRNIGLISLLRILKGSIRIESNPALCFANTIDWVSILGNTTKKYTHVIKNNKPRIQCPLCYTFKDETKPEEMYRQKHCWSFGKFQRYTSDYKAKCSETAESNSSCLTSCSVKNCRHCTNYISGNRCVDNCLPPKFWVAYERQCVSDCNQLGLIPLGSQCVEKCPKHYRQLSLNGKVNCAINCTGNFKVNAIEDLEGFADCTTIKGSLTIELFEINKPIIEDLEEAFKNLNEITGYLKILRSPQIVSLNFFKRLHTIRGDDLIENKYALFVVGNHHLEELWSNQQVAILHGRVYFHLNPRLCYDKITDLQKNLKENPKISIIDASQNSNGERVVCGSSIKLLSANITDRNSVSALILHDVLGFNELNSILGFIYYYKEVPQGNVTKFDGRHGCGHDGWFMDITKSRQLYYIIKDLKPDTRYAYFVKTITTVDNGYQMEFVSDIQYFRTLPDKPGPVAKLYIHHKSMNEIEVYWWPPRQPNGIIKNYFLHFEQSSKYSRNTDDTVKPLSFDFKSSKREQICQCPKLESESSGATPNEDDYNKKEEGIYTNSLSNFIFNKKPIPKNSTNNNMANSSFEELELLAKIIDGYEQKAIEEQEFEKEIFVLNHPLTVCNVKDPNIQYQRENNCTPEQQYPDSFNITGQSHSFTLTNLQAAIWYRISLRACVQNVTNGCGPEKVILAQTVSKSLKSVLDSMKLKV